MRERERELIVLPERSRRGRRILLGRERGKERGIKSSRVFKNARESCDPERLLSAPSLHASRRPPRHFFFFLPFSVKTFDDFSFACRYALIAVT